MDYQQLKKLQQQLMNQALSEGLKRNNEQIKIWSEYKKRHEKVIDSLKILPENLSINCMVPIGKRALMRGKVTHTNEIMVCLGDGYFAKYSSPQAISLCHRRIKKAEEILDAYKKERDLLEIRQMVPTGFDSFGNDEVKEVVEHWDDKKLEKWRDEHREQEKMYRKKLKELKTQKKTDVQPSKDDLFSRLDALEIQEELEDELERLEAEYPDYYDKLDIDEYFDESEVDSESYSSDYSEEANNTIIEKKLTKQIHRRNILNNVNSLDEESTTGTSESDSKSSSSAKMNNKSVDKSEVREKKVVFAEPEIKYFSNEEEMDTGNDKRRVSVIEQRLYECTKEDDESEDESDQDDTIRIHFKHTDAESIVPVISGNQITTPRDIYQVIPGPKSILKKRPGDVNVIQQSLVSTDVTTEEESDEQQQESVPVYNMIVKDVTEHVELKIPARVEDKVQEKRPVSRFKMERAGGSFRK